MLLQVIRALILGGILQRELRLRIRTHVCEVQVVLHQRVVQLIQSLVLFVILVHHGATKLRTSSGEMLVLCLHPCLRSGVALV